MASSYTTSKYHSALSFEGYSYRFDRLNARNKKERCRCRTRVCNGSLYTNNDQDNADIVELSTSRKIIVIWIQRECLLKKLFQFLR